MKKVCYETGVSQYRCDQVRASELNTAHLLEDRGFHVVLSKDEPEKPEIERLPLIVKDCVLQCLRAAWIYVDVCIRHPDFAGFEFEDGDVLVSPWRLDPFDAHRFRRVGKIDHAKYVLFRRSHNEP